MAKKYNDEPVSEPQPNDFKLRKFRVNLGNAFVRLTAPERLKVMRALGQFVFGKNSSVAHWDLWSKSEMMTCYLQLKPISQEMADELRNWASEHLKAEHNNRLALKSLIDELVVRNWLEEPESAIEG
jgi:hypothetical protein